MKIAPEGWPIVGPAALITAALAVVYWPLALPALGFTAFSLWFFRDPDRRLPADGEAGLVSPADGRIIRHGPRRISIFMNVFDVHVCRAPRAGVVESVQHHPGRFLAAYNDAASEHNERTTLVIFDGQRRIRFTLVAGLIARRIVCRVRPGQQLAAGDRIGVIRFGSRVDVELPPEGRVRVELGQRVVAGESILARLEATTAADPAACPSGSGSPSAVGAS